MSLTALTVFLAAVVVAGAFALMAAASAYQPPHGPLPEPDAHPAGSGGK